MDLGSIDRLSRHIKNVPRIEANLAALTLEEIDDLLEERVSHASTRWELCNHSFRMLFMAISRGSRLPIDSFEVRLAREEIGVDSIDTWARVWRDRKNDTFNVKPFTRNGRIEDHGFQTEQFGDTFNYRYGTYNSKSAKLEVSHDTPDPIIRLTRIEGKLVDNMTLSAKSIYLGALEDIVMPMLDNTEETLQLICQSALNEQLNPDLAAKLRLDNLVVNKPLEI